MKSILLIVLLPTFVCAEASRFQSVVTDIGNCIVTDVNPPIQAVFQGEKVTLNDTPYSKSLYVRFRDQNGRTVPHPMDKEDVSTEIPASEDTKLIYKNGTVTAKYRPDKNDQAELVFNELTHEASLKRYLANGGGLFRPKVVIQDFKMQMNHCELNTSKLIESLSPEN